MERIFSLVENIDVNKEQCSLNTADGGPLCSILQHMNDIDLAALIEDLNTMASRDHLTLPHPEFREVETTAFFSEQRGMTNFVFFDSDNAEHPWILCQYENLIDLVITEQMIYKTSRSSSAQILNNLRALIKTLKLPLSRGRFMGFLLSQTKPFHYFYDHLKYALLLSPSCGKSFFVRNTFFVPRTLECTTEQGADVFIYPAAVGRNYIRSKNDLSSKLDKEMESYLYSASIDHGDLGMVSQSASLSIWIGITGQKRKWIEQVEGTYCILKQLSTEYSFLEVFVDGITAPEGKLVYNSEDEAVFSLLEYRLRALCNCKVVSTIGLDYKTKIRLASRVHYFICNAGGGAMVPFRICTKPGVCHTNSKFRRLASQSDNYELTVSSFTYDHIRLAKQGWDRVDYSIPWQHIYNLLVEAIYKTSGSILTKLNVPDMETFASHADLRHKAYEADRAALQDILLKNEQPEFLQELICRISDVFLTSGDQYSALRLVQEISMFTKSRLLDERLQRIRLEILKGTSKNSLYKDGALMPGLTGQ